MPPTKQKSNVLIQAKIDVKLYQTMILFFLSLAFIGVEHQIQMLSSSGCGLCQLQGVSQQRNCHNFKTAVSSLSSQTCSLDLHDI